MDLRLHHNHVGFQALCRFPRFLLRECHFPTGGGDTVTRKDRFCLVFMDLHGMFCLLRDRDAAAMLCDDGAVHAC
jgi:hypothetical protein